MSAPVHSADCTRADSNLQIFDALDAATEAALRASIKKHGVLVPVAVDQNGRTLDGHHRQRIATELGAPFKTIEHWVAGDEHAKEIARTLNEDRRQLSAVQRRPVIADLREQGHSTPAIAKAVGVSQTQVRRDIESEELSRGAKLEVPERVAGLDGKTRPAKRPTPVLSDDEQAEADRIERCERVTYSYATAASTLHALTFGEPKDPAHVREHWLPAKNPLAGLPMAHLVTATGIRELASRLNAIADDIDANTENGALPWA